MARKSRTAVLKRQREVRKAEKAAAKREKRVERDTGSPDANRVATADDLEGYGFGPGRDSDDSDVPPPGTGRRAAGRAGNPALHASKLDGTPSLDDERKLRWLKNR
jgi:hypothetical protein